MSPSILLIANDAPSVLNFRTDLILAMQKAGCRVAVIAPPTDPATLKKITDLGCEYFSVPLSSRSFNPFKDLIFLWALYRIFRRFKPTYIFSYTSKPVIWSGLAARLAGIQNNYGMITGLGYAFINVKGLKKRSLKWVVTRLYAMAFGSYKNIFFQNEDDQQLFISLGLVPLEKTVLINGSGVNLKHFAYCPRKKNQSEFVFLLIARLLRDKGIYEFVEAAKRVRKKYPQARFQMVGWIDDDNPASISARDLDAWVHDHTIEYLGKLADVREAIQNCDVYVLPSYREGTPRSVLEAMAIGRAIITTDAPGCRGTVIPGENGLLVPIQDGTRLAEAMETLLQDPERVKRMGQRSRVLAEEKYDVHAVNRVILESLGLG